MRAGIRFLAEGALLAAGRIAAALIPSAAGAFRILILHDIPPGDEAALDDLLSQLGRRFGFIGPDEAAARLRPGFATDGRSPVLVSFDDGFRSNARIAETVLHRHGIIGLFFVCPGLIELPIARRNEAVAQQIFRGRIPNPPPLMDWDELTDLQGKGHHIAAHGMTHARLSTLAGSDLEHEIADCAAVIERRLGRRPDWYAYTFGDVNSITAEALAVISRHYRLCRSGVRGLNGADTHPMSILAESVQLSHPRLARLAAAEGALAPAYRGARHRLRAMAPP
jgi:peptidoglycan/xylan/chitin deacetylase (PgdA/CDA1 family)